jgi:hypothetical protein
MEIGLRFACQAYIEWPISIKIMTGAFLDVITTHDARFCYLIKDGDVKQQLSHRKNIDRDAIMVIRGGLHDPNISLQLSGNLFSKCYQRPHEKDWKEVEKGS